jgi:uncharacterized surface protein with fasciclin (FAS1) repeats
MTQRQLSKRNMIGIAVLVAMGLGPLAALSIGERVADEETLARAQAGARNFEPPDRYPDSAFGLPKLTGAAAETTVNNFGTDSSLFSDYRKAVQESDFGEVLEGPGPFTVFVPVDDAFAQLSDAQRKDLFGDKDKLVQLLSDHVVLGRLSATDLIQMDRVDTLGGRAIPIDQGGNAMSFGNADIIKTNLVAGNGVVHIVDGLNL